MAIKNEFKNAKDFRDFIGKNCPDFSQFYVKEVYNLGDKQYCDSPLFLYSGYSIIMAYLSDGVLSLNTYDKDFFIQHIRAGIFHESADSEEFYYVHFPKAKLINCFAKDIHIQENDDGTINNIDLIFKNGQHLHIEESNLIQGTMCSYLSE